jgi:glycosyltransferase involved in cell wall biosynthesis
MRILALTNLYPNPHQPLRASFNRQLFRAVGKQAPLQVISPIAWIDELAARRTRDKLPRDRRVTLDGLIVDHPRYLYPPKLFRYWYGSFFRASVRRTFARALDDFRPDIVFAPWAYPDGWAAVELGHAAGLPVVVKVHGSDVRVLTRVFGRRRRTEEALQRADGVIAVSKELRGQMIDLGVNPDKVHVAYSGVDLQLFHPGSQSEARARLGLPEKASILLFIGNLVPVKGIDFLIDACARLSRSGVQFRCYVIGQGPSRPALLRQIQMWRLGDHVQFVGPRPHDQLPDWFRAASVFVLPSRSEGLPTVLLEALASGTPFVASRVGGIPELSHLGRCRLVRPGDPAKLAEAIGSMLAENKCEAGSADVSSQLRSYDDEAAELTNYLESVYRTYHSRTPGIHSPVPTNDVAANSGW